MIYQSIIELASALKQRAPNADWMNGGIDRSLELATMLWNKGVRDLSQLKLVDKQYKNYGYTPEQMAQMGGDNPYGGPMSEITGTGKALDFGNDLIIGDLGDRGRGSQYGSLGILGGGSSGKPQIGWSSEGKGAVGYDVITDKDGNVSIVPSWESSNEADDARRAAIGAAATFGLGYGLNAAFGAAGAGAGTTAGTAGTDWADWAAKEIAGANANPATAAQLNAGLASTGGITSLTPAEISAGLTPVTTSEVMATLPSGITPEMISGVTTTMAGTGGITEALTKYGSKAVDFVLKNPSLIAGLVGGVGSYLDSKNNKNNGSGGIGNGIYGGYVPKGSEVTGLKAVRTPVKSRYGTVFQTTFQPRDAAPTTTPFVPVGNGNGADPGITDGTKHTGQLNDADNLTGTKVVNPNGTVELVNPKFKNESSTDNIPGFARGGVAAAYTAKYLQGPGDGVSDSIPATIDGHEPARLATNEFVIPARVVSELGNGSSDAGARKLQEFVDHVNRTRTQNKDVAADTNTASGLYSLLK